MECMPRWSLPHHPPPNSLIQLHPKPFMEIKWGPYAIWLSPLMDPPKMDQGKFGGLRNVPGPTVVCGAAASLLRFAVGKETLPGLIIRWERLESRGPPPAACCLRRTVKCVQPPGASLHGSAKPMWHWHLGIQRCLPIGPQGPQRPAASPGCSALCPAALAPKRAWSALSFPSPLPCFGGPPAWQLRWRFQDTQGWSPEPGGPMSGDTFRDTKDNRILTTLAAVSPVMLWHIVSLETFFCPALFPFGAGMEGKFPTLFHQENLSWF